MKDKKLEQANEVFKRIFDKAMPKLDIEQILNGCGKDDPHKFHSDGICRGCGRHKSLIQG